MGLLQSFLEKAGIPTTSVTNLLEITRKVDPPRALFVDLPLGYPLGYPHQAAVQRQILRSALGLLARSDLPALETWEEDQNHNLTL